MQDEDTVKALAIHFLCFVEYHEDKTKSPSEENRVDIKHPNAGSVGLSYAVILQKIKEELPKAKTTPACLRWYASQMRGGEKFFDDPTWVLPRRRPRKRHS